LVNNTAEKQIISFLTSQKVDIIAKDADGNIVYQWSNGLRFANVLSTIELEPGQEWSHEMAVPIGDGGIATGIYTLIAKITGRPEIIAQAENVTITR
jgi:hypothetical protein